MNARQRRARRRRLLRVWAQSMDLLREGHTTLWFTDVIRWPEYIGEEWLECEAAHDAKLEAIDAGTFRYRPFRLPRAA